MSDKRQGKKASQEKSKINEPTKKETKEQMDSAKKIAASSGSASVSTSGSNTLSSGSSHLPSSFLVSSFLNIPSLFPRCHNYSNAPPVTNVFPSTSSGPQATTTNSQSQPPPNDFSSHLT